MSSCEPGDGLPALLLLYFPLFLSLVSNKIGKSRATGSYPRAEGEENAKKEAGEAPSLVSIPPRLSPLFPLKGRPK